MDARDLLRGQVQATHNFLEMTIADVTPEAASKREERWTINPIGSLYAHIVISEDMIVNGMGRGAEPLLTRDGWQEKLGLANAAPRQDEHYRDMKVDIPAMREYAKAVYQETDDFLANATEEQLNKPVNMPGGGEGPFIGVLANIGVTHAAGHWGEIAALKGVQGLKGLPF